MGCQKSPGERGSDRMSTPEMVAFVLFGSLLLLFILKVPIGFSLILSSAITLVVCVDTPLQIVPQRLFTATDSFPYMAVPFFILAGNLMSEGGISQRLVKFANSLIGHLSGGLGMVSVAACMFFAAISGSSAATTAAIGGIMIPEMVRRKYDRSFSAAINAAGGTIGVIIPPSIPFVTYGVLTGASITTLFIAGFGPGILMGLALMTVVAVISKKRGYREDKKASLKEIVVGFRESILALLMPIIVLGGIYSGYFTATEAAVIAVVYALFVGVVIYRNLNMENLPRIFANSAVSTAGVLLLIAAASVFGWILTSNNIPRMIAEGIMSVSSNKIVILLLINLLLFIVGTFLDTVAALIILVPILFPIATAIGVGAVHFGMIICVNLAVGMITPPFGACLFVACGVANIKLEQIVKNILPFIAALVIVILLVTFIEPVSMFLPRLLGAL
ncbi:MAG: TRAP transporter large permease [Clostridia bacterium]